jgi:hypothetical protein
LLSRLSYSTADENLNLYAAILAPPFSRGVIRHGPHLTITERRYYAAQRDVMVFL